MIDTPTRLAEDRAAIVKEYNAITGDTVTIQDLDLADNLQQSPYLQAWLRRLNLHADVIRWNTQVDIYCGRTLLTTSLSDTLNMALVCAVIGAAHTLWTTGTLPEDPVAFAKLVYDGTIRANCSYGVYVELIQRHLVKEYYLTHALKHFMSLAGITQPGQANVL